MGRISEDKQVSSADRFWGAHTIIHDDERYMTRFWFWRMRLHIFHRGDKDQDCHDHPWDFWTFPLTSYVEEVLKPIRETTAFRPDGTEIEQFEKATRYYTNVEVVKAFRIHKRKAEHAHRVLGAWNGKECILVKGYDMIVPRKKIVTIVYQGGIRRKWGFWKSRAGRWCWEGWKKYVLEGGRDQPCNPEVFHSGGVVKGPGKQFMGAQGPEAILPPRNHKE